jgi:hypothetical protein
MSPDRAGQRSELATILYVNTFSDSIIKYDAATGGRLAAWPYFSGQSWHGFAVGASGAIYISAAFTYRSIHRTVRSSRCGNVPLT